MMQAGGGNWTHGVSNDLVHWHHIQDALDSGPPSSPFPDKGPCDGTLSFPVLGRAPYDGQAPVIVYDADCGHPLQQANRTTVGDDVARLEVALAVDPSSPYLASWEKTQPGPIVFDGAPCAFPSRVWRSEIGSYWNMLCCYNDPTDPQGLKNGRSPWARYTSSDPSLMRWKLADRQFTRPLSVPLGGYDFTANGVMFHKVSRRQQKSCTSSAESCRIDSAPTITDPEPEGRRPDAHDQREQLGGRWPT